MADGGGPKCPTSHLEQPPVCPCAGPRSRPVFLIDVPIAPGRSVMPQMLHRGKTSSALRPRVTEPHVFLQAYQTRFRRLSSARLYPTEDLPPILWPNAGPIFAGFYFPRLEFFSKALSHSLRIEVEERTS